MIKVVSMMLLLIGVAAVAGAVDARAVPEIDPGSGVSAVALLSGGLLMLRSRRKS
jgi:hypothetical protein